MRVLEVLYQPGILYAALVYFAGGKEALRVLAVYVVAVHIHVVKCIVRTYGLSLIIKPLRRLKVVYPYVGEGLHVIQNVVGRKGVVGFHISYGDILKIVSEARVGDVVIEIIALFVELVRRHHQTLHTHRGKASREPDHKHEQRHGNT